MKKYYWSYFALFLIYCLPGLYAQSDGFTSAAYAAYGMDQELVNGSQYYNRHPQASGHPYFSEDRYVSASLSINGRQYDDVWLKYDIYYQQVLLAYTSFSGASNQLVLVRDHLDHFRLGNFEFIKREGLRGQGFYQEIRTEPFTCYIYWQKRLDPSKQQAGITEQFSDARRYFSILIDGEEHSISGKKSLFGCFDPALQKELKRVLRSRNFSFRRSAPTDIVRTMQDVADTVQRGGGV